MMSPKAFKIASFNIEGFSANKATLLSNIGADILCVQETHQRTQCLSIPGMTLIIQNGAIRYDDD